MEGHSPGPRYVLRPIPLARRIRNAILAMVGFGGAAVVIGAYQAANGILRDDWIYPAGVAAIGVIGAALALMEKAWPEPSAAALEAQHQEKEPAKGGKDGSLGTPTQ